jgi:hypothetical protein
MSLFRDFFSIGQWAKPKYKLIRSLLAWLICIAMLLPHLAWAFQAPGDKSAEFIEIPKAYGRVLEQWQGTGPCVIHIQDLHCNYEVQKNIANLLDYLAEKHGLQWVAIEGADKPVNVTKLSTFPIPVVRERVGEYFIRQGKISGAEYYAATGKRKVNLLGIENPEHYRAARQMVLAFLTDECEGYVADLRERLNEAKKNLFNPRLLKLDQQKQAFHSGTMSLYKYLRYLENFARENAVALDRFPNVRGYLENASAVIPESVDSDRLYAEAELLDKEVRRPLYARDEDRLLDEIGHRVDIMEKMLNVAASPAEIKVYQNNPDAFQIKHIAEFLQTYDAQDGQTLETEIFQLDEYLQKAAAFYVNADIRSGDFAEAALRQIKTQRAQVFVLITGGFHSPKILEQLRMRGVSYLEVKPNVTHQDLLNPYFSLLKKRRTPLEKLLAQTQKTVALEPFFALSEQTTRILNEQTELTADVRTAYAWLELTLKLDALHYLQQQGVKGLEALLAQFEALLARYEANTQTVKPDLAHSVATPLGWAVPMKNAPFFAVLHAAPVNASELEGVLYSADLNDVRIAYFQQASWERTIQTLTAQGQVGISQDWLRLQLVQAALPAGVLLVPGAGWMMGATSGRILQPGTWFASKPTTMPVLPTASKPNLSDAVLHVLPLEEQRRIDAGVRFISQVIQLGGLDASGIEQVKRQLRDDPGALELEGLSGPVVLAWVNRMQRLGARLDTLNETWAEEALNFLSRNHPAFVDQKVTSQLTGRLIFEAQRRQVPMSGGTKSLVELVDAFTLEMTANLEFHLQISRYVAALEEMGMAAEQPMAAPILMDRLAILAEDTENSERAGKAKRLLEMFVDRLFESNAMQQLFMFNRSLLDGFLSHEVSGRNDVGVVYLLYGSGWMYSQALQILDSSGRNTQAVKGLYITPDMAQDPAALKSFLQQAGLDQFKELVVVDIGSESSTLQVVADTLRQLPNAPKKIHGRLFAHSAAPVVYSGIDILGYDGVLAAMGVLKGSAQSREARAIALVARLVGTVFPQIYQSPARLQAQTKPGELEPDFITPELPVFSRLVRDRWIAGTRYYVKQNWDLSAWDHPGWQIWFSSVALARSMRQQEANARIRQAEQQAQVALRPEYQTLLAPAAEPGLDKSTHAYWRTHEPENFMQLAQYWKGMGHITIDYALRLMQNNEPTFMEYVEAMDSFLPVRRVFMQLALSGQYKKLTSLYTEMQQGLYYVPESGNPGAVLRRIYTLQHQAETIIRQEAPEVKLDGSFQAALPASRLLRLPGVSGLAARLARISFLGIPLVEEFGIGTRVKNISSANQGKLRGVWEAFRQGRTLPVITGLLVALPGIFFSLDLRLLVPLAIVLAGLINFRYQKQFVLAHGAGQTIGQLVIRSLVTGLFNVLSIGAAVTVLAGLLPNAGAITLLTAPLVALLAGLTRSTLVHALWNAAGAPVVAFTVRWTQILVLRKHGTATADQFRMAIKPVSPAPNIGPESPKLKQEYKGKEKQPEEQLAEKQRAYQPSPEMQLLERLLNRESRTAALAEFKQSTLEKELIFNALANMLRVPNANREAAFEAIKALGTIAAVDTIRDALLPLRAAPETDLKAMADETLLAVFGEVALTTTYQPQTTGRVNPYTHKKSMFTPGVVLVAAGMVMDVLISLSGWNMQMGWGTGLSLLLAPYFALRVLDLRSLYGRPAKAYDYEDFRQDVRKVQGLVDVPADWKSWLEGLTQNVPASLENRLNFIRPSFWRLLWLGGSSAYVRGRELYFHENINALPEIRRLAIVAHELEHLQQPEQRTWLQRLYDEGRALQSEVKVRFLSTPALLRIGEFATDLELRLAEEAARQPKAEFEFNRSLESQLQERSTQTQRQSKGDSWATQLQLAVSQAATEADKLAQLMSFSQSAGQMAAGQVVRIKIQYQGALLIGGQLQTLILPAGVLRRGHERGIVLDVLNQLQFRVAPAQQQLVPGIFHRGIDDAA